MRVLSFVLMGIILVNVACATEIGVSPPRLNFSGETEEKICQNITLYSNGNINTSAENRWERNDLGPVLDSYHLKASDLGINVIYPKLDVNVETRKQICIQASNEGIYYGAIIYKTSNAGAGQWIKLTVFGNSTSSESHITGKAIDKNENSQISTTSVLFIQTILLVIVAIILIILFKLKKEKVN